MQSNESGYFRVPQNRLAPPLLGRPKTTWMRREQNRQKDAISRTDRPGADWLGSDERICSREERTGLILRRLLKCSSCYKLRCVPDRWREWTSTWIRSEELPTTWHPTLKAVITQLRLKRRNDICQLSFSMTEFATLSGILLHFCFLWKRVNVRWMSSYQWIYGGPILTI